MARFGMMGAACALALMVGACGGANAPDRGVTDGATSAVQKMNVVTHKGDFAEIQQFTTPGGVSVWLVQEPSIPIVSVSMSWKGGSANDPEGLEGLADMVTYNMNEGAGELEALAFQTRIEELNMSFSCSAGRDWTSCDAQMLRDNAAEAMDLVALAMTSPRFDEGPFERARREALVDIKTRATNPQFLAADAMENALYPGHPYSREETEASVGALTREAAKAYKDQLMVKDGLLVTAVGAISPQELAPMLDKVFAGLPETGTLSPVPPVTLPPATPDVIKVALPQPQTLVSYTAPAMTRDSADFFPAVVLNYKLGGGGFESRLMKELRVNRGLTYGTYTRISTGDNLNTWSGGGQTKNATAGEFINVTKEIMSGFVTDGMTEEELAASKAYLTGSYPLGFDSNAKIAGNMMSVRQDGLGVDYFDKRNAMVEAVTLEDVNRVASAYLSPDRFTFVVVGEPEGL